MRTRVLVNLVVATGLLCLALWAPPSASAVGCHCTTHFDGHEACGYGATCTEASNNLASGINSSATYQCDQLGADSLCLTIYTPGSCFFESTYNDWAVCTPSYSYYCRFCTG